MVGTVAQALTREDGVERTFILNVIGETPLTAEQNTSLVTVIGATTNKPVSDHQHRTKRCCLPI